MDIRKLGLIFAFSFSLCFISCRKECEECPGITENYIRYEGNTYELRGGRLEYYGIWEDNPGKNIDLFLYSDEGTEYYEIYFQLFTESRYLETGRYVFNAESRLPNTYNNAYFYLHRHNFNTRQDEVVYPNIALDHGELEVRKNNNDYTVTIRCRSADGADFTGFFKGKLPYYTMRTDF